MPGKATEMYVDEAGAEQSGNGIMHRLRLTPITRPSGILEAGTTLSVPCG